VQIVHPLFYKQRDGEYKKRSIFWDFVTIRTLRSMQDVTVTKDCQSVNSQNIPCATLKGRGSWVISLYLCFISTGDLSGIIDITCRIWVALIKKEEDG
jgi:hypothetical protein